MGTEWLRAPHTLNKVTGHAMTTLRSGNVILTGGEADGACSNAVCVFSPVDSEWTPGPAMLMPRTRHAQHLLPTGGILVCGGTDGTNPLNTAEVYDPDTAEWTAVGLMSAARSGHRLSTLADGRVLATGGIGKDPLVQAEIFDPLSGAWENAAPLLEALSDHVQVIEGDGRVLVAGISGGVPKGARYTPHDDAWEAVDIAATAFGEAPTLEHSAQSVLHDGRVLITGGSAGEEGSNVAAICDASRGEWIAVPKIGRKRWLHGQATLLDGRVLIVGGMINGQPGKTAMAWQGPGGVGGAQDGGGADGAPPAYPV